MARVGGRNAAFAWIVGIVCLGVVAALGVIAWPLVQPSLAWMNDSVARPAPSDSASADGPVGLVDCRDLYDNALWASLVWTPGAVMSPSTEPPRTAAVDLVAALQPQVMFTCDWTSDDGAISTTVAHVPADAGAIAATALTTAGYGCSESGTRVTCTRTEGETTDTIETGEGLWVSTVRTTWAPVEYQSRVADRVWAG
ncbi:hypothetical protein [Microbacterium telephonicum]|uniref:Uncharacterized protein n=1 Tax=Microbacterium telephonicum TaxID=1714841 RepID=A0A498BZB6_9MICO|nr:hypothetical protein [Microbacterium telephonicum]RLK48057.1 hypothetical protein C7474_2660 [Microbacterium telephonicum]